MPTPRPDARPVLVGFDGSPAARSALRFAAREAAVRHAPLRVLALAERLVDGAGPGTGLDAAERALADAARALHVDGPHDPRVDVTTTLGFGPAAAGLLEAAWGARLVVVGRAARDGAGTGLGAVAGVLAGICPVPLAVVPAHPWAEVGTRRDDTGPQSVVVAVGGERPDDGAALAAARTWAVQHRARLHVVHGLREPSGAPGPRTPAPATTLTHHTLSDAVLAVARTASLVVLTYDGRATKDLLSRLDRPVLLLPG